MTNESTAQPEESQPDDWLGTVISGKFLIVRLLGRGGMGCVYEAENVKLGRRMALKRILPAHATNVEIVSRFEVEAKAAGGLLHENILAVMDFDRAEDGTPYLVMEYLEGQSLSALLKRVPFLDSRRATDLIIQACRGLAKAHQAEIVHRDLKPANIYLCERADGTELVKVLDFGIAKLKGEPRNGENTTRPGSLIGTPKYMSPEQARGDLAVDARADVYALGVILYEALSNKLPHPGANDAQVLYHLQTTDPIPLSQHRPDLPAALCAVVAGALATDPDKRIPSAQALEQALLDATRELGVGVLESGATRAACDSDSAEQGQPGASLNPVDTETNSPVQITKNVTSRHLGFAAGFMFIGMMVFIASWRYIARVPSHVAATRPSATQPEASVASGAMSVPTLHSVPSSGDKTPEPAKLIPPPPAASSTSPVSTGRVRPPAKVRQEVSARTVHGQRDNPKETGPVPSAAQTAPKKPGDVWGEYPGPGGTRSALP